MDLYFLALNRFNPDLHSFDLQENQELWGQTLELRPQSDQPWSYRMAEQAWWAEWPSPAPFSYVLILLFFCQSLLQYFSLELTQSDTAYECAHVNLPNTCCMWECNVSITVQDTVNDLWSEVFGPYYSQMYSGLNPSLSPASAHQSHAFNKNIPSQKLRDRVPKPTSSLIQNGS